MTETPLLAVDGLSVALPPGADRPLALDDVTLTLNAGEILCVVGESGSGKSMLANTLMRLLPPEVMPTAGRIALAGEDVLAASDERMRALRGAKIAMIFQEPMTALNPLQRVGDQVAEMFRTHTELDAATIRARTLALFAEVKLPDPVSLIDAYPHALSGGQRQRVMIAMALALEPAVLIADEPTTALDVTTQARILDLIRDIQQRHGTGVLFVTHDLGVVAEIADRVVVMRAGRIVEQGTADKVLNRPRADYSRALIAAVPPLRPRDARRVVGAPILSLTNVSKTYRTGGIVMRRRQRVTQAVRDVSFDLTQGTTLGIVGESGSGKSTLARCIVRLLDPDCGRIMLEGTDMATLSRRALRHKGKRLQMVFQDPFASLNPRRRAGELVAQGPMLHGASRRDALAKAREMFTLVGLDPRAFDRYPHEFSGGQRQRIGLARALALDPKVLIADEPVSALDVSVQTQVLALLDGLRERLGLSMVFITHDLRVAAQVCDTIAVMKDGAVVEAGPTAQVFGHPQHDYTRALLAAVPGREWSLRQAALADAIA